MKRGDLVTIAGGGPYSGKPRPALVIQSDAFAIGSISVCLITSDPVDAKFFRVQIEATASNHLRQTSWIMTDKIVTLRRDQVGRVIGALRPDEMLQVNRALIIFLDLSSR